MTATELKNKKKITMATVKAFIKKAKNLQIKCLSTFDGMIDGSRQLDDVFEPIKITQHNPEHTFNISGAYFIGRGSRDYFSLYESDTKIGIDVYNSCGNFILAIDK